MRLWILVGVLVCGGGLNAMAEETTDSTWQFPEIDLSIGALLPNFALPTLEDEEPVRFYDLLAGKPTLLHIYASW